ncbi:MAG: hypothetical protein SPF89_08890 [Sphaerochaetaceae bacterium]|nr:hypothetical protein [Spirochaetales bacterium]MDY5500207.1 hypothetical protein [Sphaerochaetaceae bacterium]
MGNDFFKAPFLHAYITMVTPNEEEMTYIHEKISSELELGIIKEETRKGILRIIQHLKDAEGIDGIVIGCTELPFAFQGV